MKNAVIVGIQIIVSSGRDVGIWPMCDLFSIVESKLRKIITVGIFIHVVANSIVCTRIIRKADKRVLSMAILT